VARESLRCKFKIQEIAPGGAGLAIATSKLRAGEKASATLVQKVLVRTRSRVDSQKFGGPPTAGKDWKPFLAPTPGVESDDPSIRAKAEEIAGNAATAWEAAVRLSDFTYGHLEYKLGPFTSAKAALGSKIGDCEERAALFVALCRARKIPARVVMAQGQDLADAGHAWAEICLTNADGEGVWLPVDVGLRFFAEYPAPCVTFYKGEGYRFAGPGGKLHHSQPRWARSNRGELTFDVKQTVTPVTPGALTDPTQYPRTPAPSAPRTRPEREPPSQRR
jgi:hypothetical protein